MNRPDLPFTYTIRDVDLEEWCKEYELDVFDHPCSKCGRTLTVNVPFTAGELNGLTSRVCACGNTQVPFSYTDPMLTPEMFDNLVKKLKEQEDA